MQTPDESMRKSPSLQLSRTKLPGPVLLYLLAVAIPVQFNLGSLSLNGLKLLLLILIVPLTIRMLAGRYGRVYWTDILFLLHVLWTAVALTVNNPNRVIEFIGSTSIEFIGGYVLARAYIRNAETFIALIRFLAFLIVATLPIALYEAITSHTIIIETIRKIPGLTSFTIIDMPTRMGLDRVQAVFPHPILYGLFASVGFSLTFIGLKNTVSNPVRYLLSVVITLCVFLSLSSGALLSIVLQLGLILWAWLLNQVKYKWHVLLALLVALYITIDILSNRAPIQVFMSYATFSPHTAYYRALIFEWGMKNVWAHPVFGLGFHDWVRPWWMHSGSMDNFWLVITSQFGIPGFVFLALGYLIALWQIGTRKLGENITLLQLRRAWMFTFIGLSFTLTTVHIWSTVYSFVFFLFGTGFWFITTKPTDLEKSDTMESGKREKPIYRRPDLSPGFSRKTEIENQPESQDATPKSLQSTSDRPKYSRFS